MQLGSEWYTVSVPEMFCTRITRSLFPFFCWLIVPFLLMKAMFCQSTSLFLPFQVVQGLPGLLKAAAASDDFVDSQSVVFIILKGTSLPFGQKSRQLALVSNCLSTTHIFYVNILHPRHLRPQLMGFICVCLNGISKSIG